MNSSGDACAVSRLEVEMRADLSSEHFKFIEKGQNPVDPPASTQREMS